MHYWLKKRECYNMYTLWLSYHQQNDLHKFFDEHFDKHLTLKRRRKCGENSERYITVNATDNGSHRHGPKFMFAILEREGCYRD